MVLCSACWAGDYIHYGPDRRVLWNSLFLPSLLFSFIFSFFFNSKLPSFFCLFHCTILSLSLGSLTPIYSNTPVLPFWFFNLSNVLIPSVSQFLGEVGFFFHPSPYQPVCYAVPICCSALAWHLSLILCCSVWFFICVYIPIHKLISIWCVLKYVLVTLCPTSFIHLLIAQGEFPRYILFVECLYSISRWRCDGNPLQGPSLVPVLRASERQSLFLYLSSFIPSIFRRNLLAASECCPEPSFPQPQYMWLQLVRRAVSHLYVLMLFKWTISNDFFSPGSCSLESNKSVVFSL